MKNLIILSLLVLSSCASKKYVEFNDEIVINDTIIMPEIHDHYCDTTGCYCIYMEEQSFEYTDTLKFEFLTTRKNWRKLQKDIKKNK